LRPRGKNLKPTSLSLLILITTLISCISQGSDQPALNLEVPKNNPNLITDFGESLRVAERKKSFELQKLIIVVSNDFFSANTSDRHFTSRVIENDRPYAGYLYLTLGKLKQQGNRLTVSTLDIGVVGPYSLAEEGQKEIHRWVDSAQPQGWDNQLDNELGFSYHHDRYVSHRRAITGAITGEMIRVAGFSLGNVRSSLRLGSILRIGHNLPDDVHAGLDRTLGKEWSVFAFVAFSGELVLRDIFLDGNTFEDSHSVEKENLIGNIVFGLTAQKGAFGASLTQTVKSEDFEGQDGLNTNASVRLLFNYYTN